ncbi:hypothetical protein ACHQM5_020144 [Ranunculus cassubicifolius]
MVFSAILRRSASSLLPRTITTVTAQRSYHYAATITTLKNNIFSEEFRQTPCKHRNCNCKYCLSVRHFSSTPKKLNSDKNLLEIVKSEIEDAKESGDHDQEIKIPEEFPFKIEDEPGKSSISLERHHQGEIIRVEVQIPTLAEDENENDQDEDKDDEGKDDEESDPASSLAMVVSVSKGKNEPCLEFCCTAYSDEIVIDSLFVKNPESSDDGFDYEGPDFADLDQELQEAFNVYLQDRGIKPSTTNFLFEYMFNKEHKEYLRWLKTVKSFVKK